MAEGRRRAKEARQARPPRRPKRTDKQPEDAHEFAGMTVGINGQCADRCLGGVCYITKQRVCGHPGKGANQFGSNPEISERRKRAQRYLDHAKVEAR
jgi:hypothetical protein